MKEIVVIGAARSGTKIMRDTLAAAFGWAAVPYDIEYVWHANVPVPHDAFPPEHLSAKSTYYIRRFIQKYGLGHSAVVEKTVGNTLRVPAVHAVFPDALLVHLIRDGVNVVESSARQWRAPTDYRYVAKKLQHFPASQVPTYGVDYIRKAMRRGRSDVAAPVWGPRYPGIDQDVRRHPVEVVCAKQWTACVEAAEAGFRSVDADVLDVRYEDFVHDPVDVLRKVRERAGVASDSGDFDQAVSQVSRPSATPTRAELPAQLATELANELNPSLSRLGYDPVGGPAT